MGLLSPALSSRGGEGGATKAFDKTLDSTAVESRGATTEFFGEHPAAAFMRQRGVLSCTQAPDWKSALRQGLANARG